MNIQLYEQRLIDLQRALTARTGRAVAAGLHEFIDIAHDSGDVSLADAVASEQFAEAELDSTVLTQIQDALVRVRDGTYGKCIVDSGPIDEARLAAVPWTAYCLEHANQKEAETPHPMSTL